MKTVFYKEPDKANEKVSMFMWFEVQGLFPEQYEGHKVCSHQAHGHMGRETDPRPRLSFRRNE